MTGGIAAFVGASIIGPRMGRFSSDYTVQEMPGHNTVLQVLGTFILWLGWYGFNPGSTLGITADGYSRDAARVVATTTLSAASGGVTVALVNKFFGDKTWNVALVCNGILAGLVSITAGCSVVYTWAAALIGMLGGAIYFIASLIVLNKLHVDDPLDAFAIHGVCGCWGVFSTALLAAPAYSYAGHGDYRAGLFYGHGELLAITCIGLVAQIAWVGCLSFLLFKTLMVFGLLRVTPEVEAAGLDESEHGGSAYLLPFEWLKKIGKGADTGNWKVPVATTDVVVGSSNRQSSTLTVNATMETKADVAVGKGGNVPEAKRENGSAETSPV